MTWAVVLSGLPGVGKTTVSRALAGLSGARHLRIDTIEGALKASQAQWQGDWADAGYQVAKALAVEDLGRETPVIIDCVNPIELARAMWEDLPAKAILRVELFCSDPQTHRHRVETRLLDISGHRPSNWAEVQARTYETWTGADLRLDTAQTSPEALAKQVFYHLTENGEKSV